MQRLFCISQLMGEAQKNPIPAQRVQDQPAGVSSRDGTTDSVIIDYQYSVLRTSNIRLLVVHFSPLPLSLFFPCGFCGFGVAPCQRLPRSLGGGWWRCGSITRTLVPFL